ncbi:MAG: hypothetical protein HQK89_05485 [Nitrospirae bacterium]|nr:hypothetical protein [Nitrospirota bacterium]
MFVKNLVVGSGDNNISGNNVNAGGGVTDNTIDGHVSARFTVSSTEPYFGHVGWAILRKDRLLVSFMTTAILNRKPIRFDDKEKTIRVDIRNIRLVKGNYILYVGVFDKEAYRPLALESAEITINTGIDLLRAVCALESDIEVLS